MEYLATFLTKPCNFLCYNELGYNKFDFIYSNAFVLSTMIHSDKKENTGKVKGLNKIFVEYLLDCVF